MPIEKELKFNNKTILHQLVKNSYKAIDNGSYDLYPNIDYSNHTPISLKRKIKNCLHVPLLTEIKYASPSSGALLKKNNELTNIETIASKMESAHSSGISILTQPFLFEGSIGNILKVRKKTHLPIIMKDIIVSEEQIKTARRIGADCILLIKSIFDLGMTEGSIEKFSEYGKKLGLEIIIETHIIDEFEEAVKLNRRNLSFSSTLSVFDNKLFDIIGINNRNLNTLEIDLNTTQKILSQCDKENNLILSESGINSKDDILFLKNCGSDAFLIGTILMRNIDIMDNKINEFYLAY
jgi:indole-3-glycerol phosphate synthase